MRPHELETAATRTNKYQTLSGSVCPATDPKLWLLTITRESQNHSLCKTQQKSDLRSESDPAGGRSSEHGDCPRPGCCLGDVCGALPWENLGTDPQMQPLTLPLPAVSGTRCCSTELNLGGGRRNLYIAAAGMSHGCCREPVSALTSWKMPLTWKLKGLGAVGQ